MNNPYNAIKLKYFIFLAGLLGAGLRSILYVTGTDEKGLLISGHWAHFAIWILTAAVAVLLAVACGSIVKDAGPGPVSPLSGLGCFPAAAAFLSISLTDFRTAGSYLETAAALLGFASAAALVWIGICRLRGKRPLFVWSAVLCICFALRMVCQYRTWSSDPQLQDYCFIMLSHVALMLTAYYFAEFDAGMGRLRPTWFVGLSAAYLALLGLWGSKEPVFLLCCSLWVLTGLPSLPSRRRSRPVTESRED